VLTDAATEVEVAERGHAARRPIRFGWSALAVLLTALGAADAVFAYLAGQSGSTSGAMALVGGVVLSGTLGVSIYAVGVGRRAVTGVGGDDPVGVGSPEALYDPLTGLPGRALVMDRVEQMLARSRRHGTVGAALSIDLDDFAAVNDSLGREVGDALLGAVAARLAGTLRGADTIGRLGGDAFVAVIDGNGPMVAPELVAERVLAVMQQPFRLALPEGSEESPEPELSLQANVSIGIAVGDREGAADLLRDADVALFRAKVDGKGRYEFFHPELQTEIGRRIRLEFDLRSALAGDQFRLLYQPIYALDDLEVVGVEAFLRWKHPADGLLAPEEFLPILEETGLIREVGVWVLDQACRQMAAWHTRGDALQLSVNLSSRQLEDDRIVEHVRHALQASGLDPAALRVDVSETTLMQDATAAVTATAAVRRLIAIGDLGVGISVDDFGTGYCSPDYLEHFPVDCIKIDRSVIASIATSPESPALIATLVQLGQVIGLTTLAEGVETRDELDLLRVEGVDQGQGFLFAQPLDPVILELEVLSPIRFSGPDAHPESMA
jgi:diguanylate cyclase (GGDEF)-like protein